MQKLICIILAAALGLLSSAANSAPDTLSALLSVLQRTDDPQVQLDILRGISEAAQGKRNLPMPAGWEKVEQKFLSHSNAEVRLLTQGLGLAFGSKLAVEQLRKSVMDTSLDPSSRSAALDSLLASRDPELSILLKNLLKDESLRAPALRGLARFDQPGTAEAILEIYNGLTPAEKRDALNTLASRVNYARALMKAVSSETISHKDLTADLVRQLRNLKTPDLDEQIQKFWGSYRESSADIQKEIQRFKKLYWAGGSQPGDAVRGRLVFAKVCQQCHVLFDAGGNVGPDITGSNRNDLDYLLQNILDPNAVIPNDYRGSTLTTKDDRVLTGIIKKEDQNSVTIATANETLVIPKSDVESIALSNVSMMPEGLLAPLSEQEFRDLIYYLTRPGQVALPQ